MKQLASLFPVLLFLVVTSCRTEPAPPAVVEAPTLSLAERKAPDELFGELFQRVQMERIYPDGKTFVDMIPKASPEDIMTAYGDEKALENF
jgi:alpha,alpha-trehalase